MREQDSRDARPDRHGRRRAVSGVIDMTKARLKKLLAEMRGHRLHEEYIGEGGRECVKTFGSWAWYKARCERLGVDPHENGESGAEYTAEGRGFALAYGAGKVTLAFDA